MKQLLKKLNEPFPYSSSTKVHYQTQFGVSLFITLFLYIFQPFDLSRYPSNPFWICTAFGLITFFTAILYDLVTTHVFKLQKDIPAWTLWKWMIDMVCLVGLIGIGNYIFMTFLVGWQTFRWDHFMGMLGSTFLLGIFPIIFSGMVIQMRAYQRNQIQADTLQSTLPNPKSEKTTEQLTLSSQKNTQSITLSANQLFYVEAQQNYVSICHLQEGKIEKTIFRNTIKQIEEQLQDTSLFRCHRSFLVNTQLIETVAGNAQGLRLSLFNLPDMEVPVSRKHIATLKSLIA